MKNYKLAILAVVLVLLTSCASNAGIQCTPPIVDAYGFWGGLWHGMIVPITWIGSMFSDNVAIYAIANNGNWYDFGYAIGVGGVIFSFGKKS
jgi:hypothetical protein